MHDGDSGACGELHDAANVAGCNRIWLDQFDVGNLAGA
jgi:hypothetical protein